MTIRQIVKEMREDFVTHYTS